jgi:hypothetical protein
MNMNLTFFPFKEIKTMNRKLLRTLKSIAVDPLFPKKEALKIIDELVDSAERRGLEGNGQNLIIIEVS